jgi:DNA-binding response OmpR family regulator
MSVELRGRAIKLTRREMVLLTELARNKGLVLSRGTLSKTVWGLAHLNHSRLVDIAIHRLRQKIEVDPENPKFICTVRGWGYRLDVLE